MDGNAVKSNTGDGTQPVCDTCGVSLPEPVLKIDPEPEKVIFE